VQETSWNLPPLLQLWSPRDLDRVKGRFLHYSQSIRHLRIRVTEMQRLMGPVALGEGYDSPGPLPTGLALEFPSVPCYASLPSRLGKPEEGLEGVSFKFTKQKLVSKIYKPRLPIPAIMLTQGPWMAALALDLPCPHALGMGHYNIILQIV
jgi:hypothetical protein